MAIRCVSCGSEFDSVPPDVVGCPKCGSTSVPCDTADDVTIKVNWHELRILGIWAENYARSISIAANANESSKAAPGNVQAIAKRIEAQHPDRIPITLGGELADLKDRGVITGADIFQRAKQGE